ncbi:MAG: GNAT family N-acetyltransferase [Verrucomicrobia bacterium]|nr:GNAT family N-acetyltransferase [Verrucomicrobiota bacterium]
MIEYRHNLEGITDDALSGFFVGWPSPPSVSKFREILEKSYAVVLAWDSERSEVIGFATAISDRVFAAFMPLLEVKAEYQKRGIGSELVRRIESQLGGMYSIDIVCDPELESFYSRLGYVSLCGQAKRFRSGYANTTFT